MEVRLTRAGAGARRAVARIAVIADELDRGYERAGRPDAGYAADSPPAEVARQGACGGVPRGLVDGFGGDEVQRRAVAVGVVAGLAGGGDAQAVGAQQPERVLAQARVDRFGGSAAGH